MRKWTTSITAAAIGFFGVQLTVMTPATADETAAESVAKLAEAVADPNCIAAAVADEAVAEGVRKGRRLLSRLGVGGSKREAAATPCGTAAEPSDVASSGAAAARPAPAQATPPQTPTAETAPARERRGLLAGARQQARPSGRRDCGALGAGCADGLQPLVACVNEVTFWGEMADAVEQKRNTATGLPAADKEAMDADIAAMRAAHAAAAGQVDPVDPSKPNRHVDWLTPDEYSQAATAAAAKITARRQECNQKYSRF